MPLEAILSIIVIPNENVFPGSCELKESATDAGSLGTCVPGCVYVEIAKIKGKALVSAQRKGWGLELEARKVNINIASSIVF